MATDDAWSASPEEIASGPFVGRGGPVVWGDARSAGPGLRVGVVCSRFNGDVTMRLLEGAREALDACGVDPANVTVAWVPGAFELPLAARFMAWTGTYDAVICLGCVIRGETSHDRYVSYGATLGIQRVAMDTGIPVAFGVLTTDTKEQALARAGGSAGNKGYDAAMSACESADVLRSLSATKEAGE
jgi:6,7-dimethyl-8-ribityllumazine synthase